jgi:hypothetical protein
VSFGWKRKMNLYTKRNVVILGLVQIGIITSTVLAAGVSLKWQTTLKLQNFQPESLRWIADCGWITLVIPLAWVSVTVFSLQKENWPDQAKSATFYGGFVLLFLLLVVSWQIVGQHWFAMFSHG